MGPSRFTSHPRGRCTADFYRKTILFTEIPRIFYPVITHFPENITLNAAYFSRSCQQYRATDSNSTVENPRYKVTPELGTEALKLKEENTE
jgi:hypothetical protein